MKPNAQRDKIGKIALGVLVVVGAYEFYDNVLSSPSSSPESSVRPISHSSAPLADTVAASLSTRAAARRALQRASEDFRPSLKPKRPEDRVDPMTIDPTLRTDLLAKVQAVEMEGGSRNLFQFSAAPPPPLPKEPIVPVKKVAAAPADSGPAAPPPAPVAPPIPLKYYGYSSAGADEPKHAFFLDGDEILVAGEGDSLKKNRYRVVHIGVNSVDMEDTQFKQTQKLRLQEEPAG
jgi:hypothetical protein